MIQNYITEKIINDAHCFADAIVKDAKTKSAEQQKYALAEIQKEETLRREQHAIQQKIQTERHAYQAEMEMRKNWLDAKQTVFDEVFSKANEELVKMNAKQYRVMVAELIKKYGKTGDTVLVAKSEQERLDAAFFKSDNLIKMKLIRKIDETIENGFIISNDYYDLRLTNSELLAKVRADKQTDITKILFDE